MEEIDLARDRLLGWEEWKIGEATHHDPGNTKVAKNV
jgi:hypothetical protein